MKGRGILATVAVAVAALVALSALAAASHTGSHKATAHAVLINTQITVNDPPANGVLSSGEVIAGSFLGSTMEFCVGGEVTDRAARGGIVKTIECDADTVLRIRFSPRPHGAPEAGESQYSPWTLKGTVDGDKVRGKGWMAVRFAQETGLTGYETFAGRVVRR